MDGHTRERLGRLSRWILAGVCAAAMAAAVLALVLALTGTLEAAGGWMLHTDSAASVHTALLCPVHMPSAPPDIDTSLFYWLDDAGRILLPGYRHRRDYVLPACDDPARWPVVLRPLASPYSGYFPAGEARVTMHVVPMDRRLVLIDARAVLTTDPAGRLADTAERDWPGAAGAARLAELAGRDQIAYLLTAPLSQYDRARRLLARGPAGPAIVVGGDWDAPAVDAQMADYVAHLWRCIAQRMVLFSPDADLVRQARSRGVPAFLLDRAGNAPAKEQ